MAGFYKAMTRGGAVRKSILSDANLGLYGLFDLVLSPTYDVNVGSNESPRGTQVAFAIGLSASQVGVGDMVALGDAKFYKITSVANRRMYTTQSAPGTANAGTKGVRIEFEFDEVESAVRYFMGDSGNYSFAITGGSTASLEAAGIQVLASENTSSGVQSGWGGVPGSPALKAYAVFASTDRLASPVDITSLISSGTIDDANAVAYKISDVASQLTSVSTVKIIIGFDMTSIVSPPATANVVKGFDDPVVLSDDWFQQKAMADKGKLNWALGNQLVTTPLPTNMPLHYQNNSTNWIQTYHISGYDNYGIARRVTVNGQVYNLPVIEINPTPSQLQENKLKIATYTSGTNTPVEITTYLMDVLAPLAGDAFADKPLVSAALKPVLDNAIPPEFKDSLSYLMYQAAPALKALATPSQSLMGKHSTGSSNLGIFTGCAFWASFPYVVAPAYVSGIQSVISNIHTANQTIANSVYLNQLPAGEYNIRAFPTATMPEYPSMLFKTFKDYVSDLIIV